MEVCKQERRITEIEQRTKSNKHRIDKIEKEQETIRDLAYSVKELALSIKKTDKKVDKIEDKVDKLSEQPGKRWDLIVTVAITAIVTIFITNILGGRI